MMNKNLISLIGKIKMDLPSNKLELVQTVQINMSTHFHSIIKVVFIYNIRRKPGKSQ